MNGNFEQIYVYVIGEFQGKLDRDLTDLELEFLKWMSVKHILKVE